VLKARTEYFTQNGLERVSAIVLEAECRMSAKTVSFLWLRAIDYEGWGWKVRVAGSQI